MVTITCHTAGCDNNGIPITIDTTADSYFCGVCGNQITDIQTQPEPAPVPVPADPATADPAAPAQGS